ncbi:hypothetical protein SDC9_192808 [bioreactor metagenome]|uniref:Uncharacterized protein n=1 Tax=bioreactor metagenome TaxID=1076179 RepID=A0A645I1R3_9ZZZZ
MQRIPYRVVHPVFTFTQTTTHNSYSTIFQGSIHIGEVEVHMSVHGDNFGDAPGSSSQGIIRFGKSIEHSQVAVDIPQTLIIDYQQCIHVF